MNNMTCLRGYVCATYDEIVSVFGDPTFNASGDGKVSTEWEIDSDDGLVTIYDWKEYDDGETCRSGRTYEWHIGGGNDWATYFIADRLNKITSKIPNRRMI